MRVRLGVALVLAGVVAISWSTTGGAAPPVPAAPVPAADEKKPDEKKPDEQKVPTYKADVAPILASSCAGCHAGPRKKGGVDTGSYDAVMKSVKANEPDKSRLVKSVTGQGAKLMPPKKGLSDAQVAIIKAWIAAGAKND